MVAEFDARTLVARSLITENTAWLEFDGEIEGQPGQFVMAWLPGTGEKPFSIAWMDPFSLLVVDVGPFSHALYQMKPGDTLWIKGPLGKGFQIEGEKHLLVGGGYGAAPLFPLANKITHQGYTAHVCLGARSESGLLLSEEFAQLECTVACATEDGSRGSQGLVTDIVEAALLENGYDTLYACGPTGLLSALADVCRRYPINYQLSWEAHMRCGLGLCGSCEVFVSLDSSLPPGWLACFDGPVFRKIWD